LADILSIALAIFCRIRSYVRELNAVLVDMAMKIPVIRGLIDRRILVNYQVNPTVLAAALPAPFRPKLVCGMGMAGICLIRLKHIRPWPVPAWLGISSENAAHRVAVEWDERGEVREGVYVRRRDTNSGLNTLAGGRIFPGIHHRAAFSVKETSDKFEIALQSRDGQTAMSLRAVTTDQFPSSSIFGSLTAASGFFQGGSLGFSATPDSQRFQGLELRCKAWRMEALEVTDVRSSYFDNECLFPKHSIRFDSALLMRGIEHEWHGEADLCCQASG
jgi:hypothetical protein